MKTKILIVITTFISLHSCKKDAKAETAEKEEQPITEVKSTSPSNDLNISILLDLSDRINPEKYPAPAMEYYQRDIGYLESVAKSFEWHLLHKKVIQMDDKIQVFIDPEPFDPTLNKKVGELKTHFTKVNVSKDSILLVSEKFSSISRAIYKAAIDDNNYVGSDIWGFFKNKVDDYCIDDGYRNILVILTDGYIFHKDAKMNQGNRTSYLTPQWIDKNGLNNGEWQKQMDEKDFGFMVASKDLSHLEVLVLGINPNKGNPYEGDVIRTYWSKWLDVMNVKKYELKQADLPTHMDKIIQDFILNKE
ncbi:hypothetical protein [Flagellimonas halotolerans]|uniref:VWFA domain-containing protein n=1 Tax=Flagellimonas halotolerans TaxID=3112164 RepID=A0ABU6IPE6_9FLAO|nr:MULTISPECIES: hypothetical protein [unclassified Allomuricauda]MEC3965246.1 hypothetical protein [Muricauda sp. SYSU M86414]MEC4264909.1 hypothetical protein [Muricauda sp. SYSU M84420]